VCYHYTLSALMRFIYHKIMKSFNMIFFFRIFERLCLLEQNSFDNQPFTCVLMEAIIIFFVAG
jgi:hypothetical protein